MNIYAHTRHAAAEAGRAWLLGGCLPGCLLTGRVVCCMAHVVCCVLVCCMLSVACCLLHVACCLLHVHSPCRLSPDRSHRRQSHRRLDSHARPRCEGPSPTGHRAMRDAYANVCGIARVCVGCLAAGQAPRHEPSRMLASGALCCHRLSRAGRGDARKQRDAVPHHLNGP